MGFVVEITSRSGRVEERQVFNRPGATVGRGYGNDVILADPYVAPEHLRVTNDLNGLAVEVLDGAALTQLDRRALHPGRTPIPSGAELTIGRTHLRVLSTEHPVEPTRPFKLLDRWLDVMAQPVWLSVWVAVYLGAELLSMHFSSYGRLEPTDVGIGFLTLLALISAWALVWSVITRISRGEPRFLAHVLAATLCGILSIVFDWVNRIQAFNLGSPVANEVVNYIGLGVVLALLLSLALRIAFRQTTWVRQLFAQGISWVAVGYVLLTSVSFDDIFSAYPEYDATLMPHGWYFGTPQDPAQFHSEISALFEVNVDDEE